jgi:hypothetical protein
MGRGYACAQHTAWTAWNWAQVRKRGAAQPPQVRFVNMAKKEQLTGRQAKLACRAWRGDSQDLNHAGLPEMIGTAQVMVGQWTGLAAHSWSLESDVGWHGTWIC